MDKDLADSSVVVVMHPLQELINLSIIAEGYHPRHKWHGNDVRKG